MNDLDPLHRDFDGRERGALAGLLRLSKLGPHRLRVLAERYGGPHDVVDVLARGAVDDDLGLRVHGRGREELLASWQAGAARIDPDAEVDAHAAAGVEILCPVDPAWPDRLRHDPVPSALLFVAGDVGALHRPGVSVVGTRRCSAAGAKIARRLGSGLADAGLTTISGLALGIDGHAHRGALGAGGTPVGVVACGLDVAYPKRHAGLWAEVRSAGVLVSEYPLGVEPARWRFPARNRIIASLGRGVVVVESKDVGGSMITAEAAIDRSVPVFGVPGSVLSPVSAGPNQLLFEGAGVVRDVDDLLLAVGHVGSTRSPSETSGPDLDDPEPDLSGLPDGAAAAIAGLRACASPQPLAFVAAATSLPVDEVAVLLTTLELDGIVRRVAGGYELAP